MLEEALKVKVMRWVRKNGFFVFKHYGGPFSQIGIPDLILCYNGFFIAIELKATGKKPTLNQIAVMKRLKQHGAKVEWFDNYQETVEWLISIREQLDRTIIKLKLQSSP